MRSEWLLFLFAVVTLGCGATTDSARTAGDSPAKTTSAFADKAGQPSSIAVPANAAVRRKIIYRATVELVVDNFDPVQKKVDSLVERYHGYLAKSNVSGRPGVPRSGRWTIRVPVDRYSEFMAAARDVGEVRRIGSDSQDVTEEFSDVEARIRNKKQEEVRLKELLDKATGKLDEILTVEREITRVRGEVEQLEGRMRVLADQTALATVELQVDEIKDYEPEEAATYGTQVRRSFEKSLAALVSAGKHLSIVAVVLSPWLAVLLVIGLPLVFWGRAIRRRKG
jgi:hypothetical protein